MPNGQVLPEWQVTTEESIVYAEQHMTLSSHHKLLQLLRCVTASTEQKRVTDTQFKRSSHWRQAARRTARWHRKYNLHCKVVLADKVDCWKRRLHSRIARCKVPCSAVGRWVGAKEHVHIERSPTAASKESAQVLP